MMALQTCQSCRPDLAPLVNFAYISRFSARTPVPGITQVNHRRPNSYHRKFWDPAGLPGWGGPWAGGWVSCEQQLSRCG
jgi:hypothetical protein